MVNIRRGEIWWADLSEPIGSSPGFRRPVIIVQSDALNRSKIRTAICIPLTSNLTWAEAPGNVLLSASTTGLPKDSVANASQIVTVDRTVLTDQIGKLSDSKLDLILRGIDTVLGK